MESTELRSLISRVKKSDHQAFEAMFNHYHESLYRFLLFKTRDEAAAEDLLQEVFIKVWNNRTNLDEEKSFKTYLYTIAENQALNHFRHLKVVGRHQQQTELNIFSNHDNPHFLLEEKEWERHFTLALESLPEKTREVFLLSRIENFTYQEIADRLNLTIKAVEAHIVKALKILRGALAVKKI